MDDIYKNIEEYNPNKEGKILTVFDDIIADMLSSKSLQQIIAWLFTKGRKRSISLVFIMQSYFATLKNARINSTHFLLCKFQANESFNKFHSILYHILTLKTLLIFTKKIMQNHILL